MQSLYVVGSLCNHITCRYFSKQCPVSNSTMLNIWGLTSCTTSAAMHVFGLLSISLVILHPPPYLLLVNLVFSSFRPVHCLKCGYFVYPKYSFTYFLGYIYALVPTPVFSHCGLPDH